MKLNQVLLAVAAITIPAPSIAGGTLGTNELTTLLRQQPVVYEALLASFTLSESAFAEVRFGDSYPGLTGERAGPYKISAKNKSTKKTIDVILCTKYEFIGSDGRSLSEKNQDRAESINETLTAVMLHEPSNNGPLCP